MELCSYASFKIYTIDTFFYKKMKEVGPQNMTSRCKVNLFQYDLVLIPIHLPMHWCLCSVQPSSKKITYYDSLGGSNEECLNSIFTFLACHKRAFCSDNLDVSEWTMTSEVNIQRQKNCYDCGVFVCWFARRLCDEEPCYSIDDVISGRRATLQREILTCSLIVDNYDDIHLANVHHPKLTLWSDLVLKRNASLNDTAGMVNFGQTCFMNSVLQVLFHCPPFVNWLLGDKEHRLECPKTDCITCILAETMVAAHTSPLVEPRTVLDFLPRMEERYAKLEQEDAHEFMRQLLARLHHEFLKRCLHLSLDLRSQETSPIHGIFGGYIRVEVTCHGCHHTSMRCEPFLDLQMRVENMNSVEDGLKEFFSKESIEGYKCNRCRSLKDASKRILIEKTPPVLCLQMKRFEFDQGQGKVQRSIKNKPLLNLSPFIHEGSPFSTRDAQYRLISVVTHVGGSAMQGHYYAIAQCSNSNFLKFDDSVVTPTSLNSCINTDGYIIMYMQVSRK